MYLCFLPNEDLMERRKHVTVKSINERTVFKCSVCVDLNRHYKNNLQSCIVYVSDRVLVNALKSWCSTYMLQIRKTLKKTVKNQIRKSNSLPPSPNVLHSISIYSNDNCDKLPMLIAYVHRI